ncbi:28S ribosomal protein S10, mitochondrial [Pseudolycoriella hygida]|uniref:Small ribosomal subunit protein uS10m n=1 Tax=Pseudolycoriella hygida TaxID=35572 RepID=A0A9Q0MPM3_9DIPT|nr:28S ribosomal protein S10, mitochondrial [Pseudolycoriella hygida]
MLKTLALAYNPIRSIIQQQPRALLCSLNAATTTTATTKLPLVNQQQQPSHESDEPDKLYKKLEIELKGIDPAVLNSYSFFATTAAQHLGIEVGKCWALRKARKDRLTLLKSVFIYKKHRVQYEIRTYYRFMHFHRLTGSTLDTFLEYIQRNLPEGVGMKATKIEVQTLPDHLKEPPAKV